MQARNSIKALFLFVLILFCMQVFADNTSSTSTSTLVQDTLATGLIKAKIALDKNLANEKVDVNTNNGIAIYTGEVNSTFEIKDLEELANSTTGINKVDTSKLIILKSTQPVADAMITAKVKLHLYMVQWFKDANFPASNIHVETKNGIVYLFGTVANATQEQLAVAKAHLVSNVVRVVPVLVVKK